MSVTAHDRALPVAHLSPHQFRQQRFGTQRKASFAVAAALAVTLP
jgi:hypothetical protein